MTTKKLYDLLIHEALAYLHTDFNMYLKLLELAYVLRTHSGGSL